MLHPYFLSRLHNTIFRAFVPNSVVLVVCFLFLVLFFTLHERHTGHYYAFHSMMYLFNLFLSSVRRVSISCGQSFNRYILEFKHGKPSLSSLPLQHPLQHLIYLPRVSLPFHCFHSLPYQESNGFFLPSPVVFHRLGVVGDDFLYCFFQSPFVAYRF